MRNVYLQTYRNNRICWKLAYILRKIQTLRVNNSTILTIKNANLSGYYFYMNMNMWGDFQICISVPLMVILKFVYTNKEKVDIRFHSTALIAYMTSSENSAGLYQTMMYLMTNMFHLEVVRNTFLHIYNIIFSFVLVNWFSGDNYLPQDTYVV